MRRRKNYQRKLSFFLRGLDGEVKLRHRFASMTTTTLTKVHLIIRFGHAVTSAWKTTVQCREFITSLIEWKFVLSCDIINWLVGKISVDLTTTTIKSVAFYRVRNLLRLYWRGSRPLITYDNFWLLTAGRWTWRGQYLSRISKNGRFGRRNLLLEVARVSRRWFFKVGRSKFEASAFFFQSPFLRFSFRTGLRRAIRRSIPSRAFFFLRATKSESERWWSKRYNRIRVSWRRDADKTDTCINNFRERKPCSAHCQ